MVVKWGWGIVEVGYSRGGVLWGGALWGAPIINMDGDIKENRCVILYGTPCMQIKYMQIYAKNMKGKEIFLKDIKLQLQ